jgi:hypothetical protein
VVKAAAISHDLSTSVASPSCASFTSSFCMHRIETGWALFTPICARKLRELDRENPRPFGTHTDRLVVDPLTFGTWENNCA